MKFIDFIIDQLEDFLKYPDERGNYPMYLTEQELEFVIQVLKEAKA